MKILNRVFVSFDEPCPYKCKYCFSNDIYPKKIRTTEEIVDSISSDHFDIVYVSQKNDNFSNPTNGFDLCHRIFDKYSSNIFIITRNVFNDAQLSELEEMKRKMQKANRKIFIAVSLNAMDSITLYEDLSKVPSPNERIGFLKKLSDRNFMPILLLRPIFPNNIIPIDECLRIIDLTYQHISCVVSSGLGVNDKILKNLDLRSNDLCYNEDQEYLQGAIDCEIKFVNVDEEINQIREKCESLNLLMFGHSIPALNFIADQMNKWV